MFRSRRPHDMPKLRQKLADAAVSLAEAAASEEGSSEGEREPPLAVDLQAHPDPVRGAFLRRALLVESSLVVVHDRGGMAVTRMLLAQ